MSIIDDPDWYDNGPGSESWKRKMAVKNEELDERYAEERSERWMRLDRVVEKLESLLERTRGSLYPDWQLIEETIEAINSLKRFPC